jgi:diaminopimelate epimerase
LFDKTTICINFAAEKKQKVIANNIYSYKMANSNKQEGRIKFTKMHGAGNDYIYVNTLLYKIADPEKASKQWSAYHTGIGSDGLVLICKPSEGVDADFKMRIFNADGSEAMMCGNASRCIGKYVYERGMTTKKEIRLETLSGIKILKLHLDDNNKVKSVTVDMGEPKLHVPEQYDETAGNELISGDREFQGTFVSMGNPHFVTFVDDIQDIDISHYGKILERDKAFPQRCNIEFAQVTSSGEIRTRVWERGSGITMACGTGACATAVAAVITNRSVKKCIIKMDGGNLEIEWGDDGHIYMTGPAAFVFDGEICQT